METPPAGMSSAMSPQRARRRGLGERQVIAEVALKGGPGPGPYLSGSLTVS